MITNAVYSLCVCACFFSSSCHFMKFCSIHLCRYCCRRFVCFVVLSLFVFLFFLALLCFICQKTLCFFFHSLLLLFDEPPKTLWWFCEFSIPNLLPKDYHSSILFRKNEREKWEFESSNEQNDWNHTKILHSKKKMFDYVMYSWIVFVWVKVRMSQCARVRLLLQFAWWFYCERR